MESLGQSPLSGLRVLVVEDDPESLHLLGALLSLWGHEPSLVENGAAGLEAALDRMPDVALLDLGLPGIDGFEVARRMRRSPGGESVLIVAVTGFRGEEHQRQAEEAGFDKYLMKPVDTDTLREVLAYAARRLRTGTGDRSHAALG